MGSTQSSSGYLSVRDATYYQNVKNDVIKLEARIAQLKNEGKPTHEAERVLELALSDLQRLESK